VVASPNNPTGTPLRLADVRALHALVAPTGVLVVDEAYAEFSDAPSALDLIGELDRLIVVRTLSKAFGLAGLRLGYAVTSAEIVDALRIVRLPYHLSTTTQVAACVAVRHAAELLATVREVVAERDSQADWLRSRGVPVAPSHANFLLIGPMADSRAVFTGLLSRDVLVRETGVAGCLRVSIGTPAENEAFRAAFTATSTLIPPTDPNGEAP
jgi:histidinol-phosphate aminotransferase